MTWSAVALVACAPRPHADATSGLASEGWTRQASGSTASLRGVSAPSARVVWASGSGNTVLRSVDGGVTWTARPVAGAEKLDFRSVHAFGPDVAVVASAGDGAEGQARIYRTTDGGASWTLALADSTKGVFLDGLAFWDATHGVALSDPVGGRFVIFTTSDGGASWRRVAPEAVPVALTGEAAFAAGGAAITTAAGTHAWFVTGGPLGARVYHSSDRGAHWSVTSTPIATLGASAGLFAVAFRDARHGVALGGDYNVRTYVAGGPGRDNVVRTSDGATWTLADAAGAARGYWSGATYVPGAATPTIVAVGLSGTARSRDDGATWTRIDTVAYNAVAFAAAQTGWAVGGGGRIARWGGGR